MLFSVNHGGIKVMFRDVVLPDTTAAEWPRIRASMHARIEATMGVRPKLSFSGQYEIVAHEQKYGLEIQKIRFQAVPGVNSTTYGRIVLPPPEVAADRCPAVLCHHGTDRHLAHLNNLSPEAQPNRQYGIELARRGFVTMAVDQFAFGEGNGQDFSTEQSRVEGLIQASREFQQAYPDWAMDGVRLYVNQCALDILAAHARVDGARLGTIGNSLGGRTALYLAAFDERVKACVASTGVSPNLTNLFRTPDPASSLSPNMDRAFRKTGVPPFEYQELMALVAPRMLVLFEPWNDTIGGNPMIEANFRCFEKARFVYRLLGRPDNFQFVCHGDGHDTRPALRQYAYALLERELKEPDHRPA
jgi:pimeloyl-ACP methyl ester carboxylesterase